MVSSFTSAPRSGFYYFAQGWKLVSQHGIRRFVILPLLVNILLMGAHSGGSLRNSMSGSDSHELCSGLVTMAELSVVALAVISVLLVFGYFFSTIANWIAAPFNGLLAEQLEARLTGATPPDTGIFGIMKDVPRIMKREWQKFAWYLPRAIVLLILYFIHGIGQTVAPVLWFLFSARMLAIQYCDYPFDNHKVPFKEMRTALRTRKITNMQFGALTSLFTMIRCLICSLCPLPFVARRRCGLIAIAINTPCGGNNLPVIL